ncbi:protein FAM214B [Protopterus annectens]|uniref:protein FAM214B n=1 Tax=Protopterus annectens TaxID=7888 RepID=UPI001CFB7247|nr:protein FAM214B [Protopterus annectens]
MRHIHPETCLKEQGTNSLQQVSGHAEGYVPLPSSESASDSHPLPECRLLIGYKSESESQQVYQLSIFSHSSQFEPRNISGECFKKGLSEYTVETNQNLKKVLLESAHTSMLKRANKRTYHESDCETSGVFSSRACDRTDLHKDESLEEEMSVPGSAQHFCHSGLHVTELGCENQQSWVEGKDISMPQLKSSRDIAQDSEHHEAALLSQHISCSTLHINQQKESFSSCLTEEMIPSMSQHIFLGSTSVREHICIDSNGCGLASSKKLDDTRNNVCSKQGILFGNQADGMRDCSLKGGILSAKTTCTSVTEVDFNKIAQKNLMELSLNKDGGLGQCKSVDVENISLGLSSSLENGELLASYIEKETSTRVAEGMHGQSSVCNGLASSEKTPVTNKQLISIPVGCPVKRKLLPSSDLADSCSEDEGPSPAKKNRVQFSQLVPVSCRSTDAKGAPFWNHLLPSARETAKNSNDFTSVGRRVKSGFCYKTRHRSARRGTFSRPSTGTWAAATISHSLLGNFEESILKGRFPPSGRIEGFTAEIGASGSYCPPHATLPVEVTYFDIAEHTAPSPFLGVISLESLGRKGYSVPKTGTIQVTLFNPNKTVVKMFLMTYDFKDMPQNHVTFLRHRIFLVPVEENEGGTSGHQNQIDCTVQKKRILCYLMHLRFQSSKSGKIYLHKDIRLLFSRKSIEIDTGIPYELKSFTEIPKNPKYSPRL